MVTKRILIPFLSTILVLSVLSPLLVPRQAKAQSRYPIVSITPPSSFGAVDENLNVSIVVANVVGLFLYQVYIDYSPDVVSVVNITEGNLLQRGGAYTTFWRAVYDNSQGLVQVANSLLRGAQTVTGIGEAFIVTFKLNKAGGSLFHLHDVMLANQFGGQIIPVFTEDATVSTAKLEITPNLIRPTASNDYSINKTFNVNITLVGAVSSLYAYDLNVTYRKDVLEATSVTLLPFMGTPNANQTQIDSGNGTISLSLECTPPASSTNVTGTLATIAFRVIGVGDASIEISENATLADKDGRNVVPNLGSASFNNQYGTRNIGILDSTLSSYEVTAGDSITETIIVKNDGSANETLLAAAHARKGIAALVAGPSTFTIQANTSETITMTLKTEGLDGNYTVDVFIFYLPEETTYQDNNWTINQPLLVHAKAEETPPLSTTFYAGVAIVVIIIAVVAAYILVRRRRTP